MKVNIITKYINEFSLHIKPIKMTGGMEVEIKL